MKAGLLWEALSKGFVLLAFLLPAGCDGLTEKAALDGVPSPLFDAASAGFGLVSPLDLPRRASVETAFIDGDERETGWPSQRVTPAGDGTLEFSPQWDDAAPAVADISYALYCLSAPEAADFYTIRFDWQDEGPGLDDLWIGAGNFDGNVWDWLRVQSSGVVAIPASRHLSGSDQIYLAVACLGSNVWVLNQLAISVNGTVVNGTIAHDGLQREYVLYIPASYTGAEPVPLVFNFHGYTGTAATHMERGDFRALADAAGFIVVHPQGAPDIDGRTHWNVVGHGPGSDVDDVGFTMALLDELAADYSIDLARVYATGMSNGGFMSYLLACEMNEQFAAVASVAATMANALMDGANPPGPIAVMEIHGTADGLVPYDGTADLGSIDEVLQYWVGHNSCDPAPTTTALPDLNTSDGSTVEYIVYGQGDSGVTVEHYRVIGGGHTWPGSEYGQGNVNWDIDASERIWQFFSKYDSSGLIE